MTKQKLIQQLHGWIKDFEDTTPSNLMAGDSGSTFEEDAYQLMQEAVVALEQSPNNDVPKEVIDAIEDVIDYQIEDERKHWQESGRPRSGHIYHSLKTLQKFWKEQHET